MKYKLSGTNLIVVQSLVQSLNLAASRVSEIRSAIDEVIPRIGGEVMGEQEGDGRYILGQEPDGSFFISWELKLKQEGE